MRRQRTLGAHPVRSHRGQLLRLPVGPASRVGPDPISSTTGSLIGLVPAGLWLAIGLAGLVLAALAPHGDAVLLLGRSFWPVYGLVGAGLALLVLVDIRAERAWQRRAVELRPQHPLRAPAFAAKGDPRLMILPVRRPTDQLRLDLRNLWLQLEPSDNPLGSRPGARSR